MNHSHILSNNTDRMQLMANDIQRKIDKIKETHNIQLREHTSFNPMYGVSEANKSTQPIQTTNGSSNNLSVNSTPYISAINSTPHISTDDQIYNTFTSPRIIYKKYGINRNVEKYTLYDNISHGVYEHSKTNIKRQIHLDMQRATNLPLPHERIRIGDGTYGKVYKFPLQNIVLKRTRQEEEASQPNVRELATLAHLRNLPHLINMKRFEIEATECNIEFLEYIDQYDADLYDHHYVLSQEELIDIAYQILNGIAIMQNRGIYHRDLKTKNILIRRVNDKYEAVIADYGLIRFLINESYEQGRMLNKENMNLTTYVQTLWYRCPELLLNNKYICDQADVWSIGIILVELLTSSVMFSALNEKDMVAQIVDYFGMPTEEIWPGVTTTVNKEFLENLSTTESGKFTEKYKDKISPEFMDLIMSMLQYNPNKRITVFDALNHPVFNSVKHRKIETKFSDIDRLRIIDIHNDIFSIRNQPFINEKMIEILNDWLLEVSYKFKLSSYTYFLCCKLVKRSLTHMHNLSKDRLQLLGISCLYLASCVYDKHPMNYRDLIFICSKAYTRLQLQNMIVHALKTLHGDIFLVTHYNYLVTKYVNYIQDKERSMIYVIAEYLLTLCDIHNLLELSSNEHRADMCINIAKDIINNTTYYKYKSIQFKRANDSKSTAADKCYKTKINLQMIKEYFLKL